MESFKLQILGLNKRIWIIAKYISTQVNLSPQIRICLVLVGSPLYGSHLVLVSTNSFPKPYTFGILGTDIWLCQQTLDWPWPETWPRAWPFPWPCPWKILYSVLDHDLDLDLDLDPDHLDLYLDFNPDLDPELDLCTDLDFDLDL